MMANSPVPMAKPPDGQRQFDQQYGACGKGWHRCGGLRRHGHLEEWKGAGIIHRLA